MLHSGRPDEIVSTGGAHGQNSGSLGQSRIAVYIYRQSLLKLKSFSSILEHFQETNPEYLKSMDWNILRKFRWERGPL